MTFLPRSLAVPLPTRLDCFAPLAMTEKGRPRPDEPCGVVFTSFAMTERRVIARSRRRTKPTRRSAYHGLLHFVRNDERRVIARSLPNPSLRGAAGERSKPDAVLTMDCFAPLAMTERRVIARSRPKPGIARSPPQPVIARSRRRRSKPDAVLTMDCFTSLAMTKGESLRGPSPTRHCEEPQATKQTRRNAYHECLPWIASLRSQ